MLRFAISVWWAAAVLCCANQIDSSPKKASVEGVVIDSLTRQPLRKAHVSLSASNEADEAASYGTTTGDNGEFSFEGLDPGKYDGATDGNHSSWKVVLIPDFADPTLLDLRSRTASVDQNGGFTLETIAPGSYRLYAFEKIAEDAWDNPDFLKQLEAEAQTISLKADQSAQVTLPLILLRKTEQILVNLGLQ
jgi:hypothetical protein